MAQTLNEWTVIYIKNKDLLQRKLKGIEEKGSVLTCTYTDKVQEYILQEQLDCRYEGKSVTFVCPAARNNLDYLLKEWKNLTQKKNTTIIFVNLENSEKCIINPSTHQFVADEESLELGLRSMFAQVAGLPAPPELKKRKEEEKEEEE